MSNDLKRPLFNMNFRTQRADPVNYFLQVIPLHDETCEILQFNIERTSYLMCFQSVINQ